MYPPNNVFKVFMDNLSEEQKQALCYRQTTAQSWESFYLEGIKFATFQLMWKKQQEEMYIAGLGTQLNDLAVKMSDLRKIHSSQLTATQRGTLDNLKSSRTRATSKLRLAEQNVNLLTQMIDQLNSVLVDPDSRELITEANLLSYPWPPMHLIIDKRPS